MMSPASAASGTIIAASNQAPGCGPAGVTQALVLSKDDPIASLERARLGLESSSNGWADVLFWASIVVAIGVILEFFEDVVEVWETVKAKQRVSFNKQIVFVGTILVILGVIGEFWAEGKEGNVETKIRGNAAAEQCVLRARADAATKIAVDAANRFGGLKQYVDAQEKSADTAISGFRRFAADEKRKTDAVITDLNKNRLDLDKARVDAQASAAAAKQDVADMTTALNQEKDLRDRFAKLVQPRQLTDAQYAEVVAAMKLFPKTKVDFALTRAPESGDLAVRLTQAAKEADWDIQPWSGGGLPLVSSVYPDIQYGEVTAHGLQIKIDEVDNEKLAPAVLALLKALTAAGIPAFGFKFPEKGPDGKAIPNTPKAGMVHIVVGSRD
jgi:hypothetical protein